MKQLLPPSALVHGPHSRSCGVYQKSLARARFPLAQPAFLWCAACVITLVIVGSASAATFTWDGGDVTNSNFGQAANWNPDGAPATNANADLIFTGTVRLTPNAEAAYTVNSITFASFAGANAFTIGGSQLSVGAGGITNNDSDTNTINNTVAATASTEAWTAASGALVFGGAVAISSNTFTFNAATGSSTMSGVVSVGGPTTNFNKTGVGTLTLSGTSANTGSGAINVNAGTLILNKTAGVNAIAGNNIGVGDGVGGVNADVLQLNASNQIVDTAQVSVGSSGLFNLNNQNETIQNLFNGGNVTTGSGTLTVNALPRVDAGGTLTVGTGAFVTNSTAFITGTVTTGTGTFTANAGVSMNGGTINGNTSLTNSITANAFPSSSTISGTLTLASGVHLFSVAQGTALIGLDVSAMISGTGSIDKSDSGVLRLSGPNNFSGGVTLDAGTLAIGNNSALGTGTFTINGGTISADSAARTVSNPVTLSGSPNIIGSQDLTFSGTTSVSGSRSLIITNTGVTTFSGPMTGTSSDSLTKFSAGTLVLSGTSANTFGNLTVNAGQVILNKTAGVNAFGGNLIINNGGTVQLGASDQIPNTATPSINAGGLLDLNGRNETFVGWNYTGGSIQTSGGTLTTTGDITAGTSSTTASFTGNLNLGGGIRNLLVQDGAQAVDLNMVATISNGTLQIGNAVSVGTVRLAGSGSTANFVLNPAGVLSVGSDTAFGSGTLTISGGTIQSETGAFHSIANPVTINGDFTVGGTDTLDFGGTTTLASSPTITVNSTATTQIGTINESGGSRGLTKNGPGTLKFDGNVANTYTGATTVNDGTLLLSKSPAVNAIAGSSLSIGNGTGGVNADVVRLLASDQIADTTAISIHNTGLFDLSGSNETIGALTMDGGNVTTGSGTLTLAADVTGTANSNTATISGNLNIGLTRTFTIADGVASTDLDISAQIVNGGTLIKAGPGTMALSGNVDNQQANTIVNEGVLLLNKNPASGTAITGNLVIGDGAGGANADVVRYLAGSQIAGNSGTAVTVNSSGLLDLNGFTDFIGNLVLAGGNVTTGAGTLGIFSFATITSNASATSATISGNLDLDGATHVITVADGAAAVDLDISAAITNGGITKSGAGALRLSGSNSLTTATVAAGSVLIANNAALGTATLSLQGGTIQADGAARALSNAVTVSNSSAATVDGTFDLTLNGLITVPSTGTLVKNGSGTLSLTNSGNSLAGGLVLNAGTLALSNSQTIANGGAFTQNGGTETGILVNNGAFIYNGGMFSGQLQNNGSTTFNADFTAGGGLTNSASMTINSGRTLTLNGAGLDNEGTLTLNGGILSGSGLLTNNGLISGNGSVSGSGGLSNNSVVNVSGSNLLLTNSGTNTNTGTINGTAGLALQIDSNLTNTGTINLYGGTLRGAGTLTNATGGTLATYGTISIATLNNTGGTILAQGGTLRLNNPLTNAGIIQVASGGTLAGAAVTNNASIQGAGSISNAVTNSSGGTIEPVGGTLTLTGVLANSAGSTINAAIGNKLLVSSGLATNAGTINLSGGTFDNNDNALSNTGSIVGYGTFRSGGTGLTNNGSVLLAGGSTSVSGSVTNTSGHTIEVRNTPAIFTDPVTNNSGATFKTTNTTATFASTFTNNGIFASDPATQYFQNLSIGNSGVLKGSSGDLFIVNGNLINNSTQNSAFNISGAQITLATGAHTIAWSGADLGANPAGFTNNFAIGTFELNSGNTLRLTGGALYIHAFELDGGVAQISSITGNGSNIYYDANNPANAYLNDGTYALQGGGELEPVEAVPEPSALALFVIGGVVAIGLWAVRSTRSTQYGRPAEPWLPRWR